MKGMKIKFSDIYSVRGDRAETTGGVLQLKFQKYKITNKFISFISLETNIKFSGILCGGRTDYI
jgi:hypothetical protein